MSAAPKGRDSRLTLAGEPRVQLLPPIVQEREKARSARRTLVAFVVLSLVVVAGGYAFALFRAGGAQQALVDAQNHTQSILSEQATYSEGTRVANEVAETQEAQKVVTSLEILWGPVIDEVRGMIPAGATLDSVTVTGQAPWEAILNPAGPLRAPHIGEIVFVVKSDKPIDVVKLAAKLATIVGYADSTVISTLTECGKVKTTVSLTLNEAAISGRYLPGALEDPTDPVPDEVPDEEPAVIDGTTPTPTPTPTDGAN
ncbi:MAG: hypothetical protein ABUL47_01295 [Leifsonia sp.]